MLTIDGCSSACCTVMPNSTTLRKNCSCACGCVSAPGVPNAIYGLPSFNASCGIDGLPHALARRSTFTSSALEPEVGHAVVQHEAGAFDDVAAAEEAEERRGDRHHVAVLVDDREIRRVAVLGCVHGPRRDRATAAGRDQTTCWLVGRSAADCRRAPRLRSRDPGSISARRAAAYSFDSSSRIGIGGTNFGSPTHLLRSANDSLSASVTACR